MVRGGGGLLVFAFDGIEEHEEGGVDGAGDVLIAGGGEVVELGEGARGGGYGDPDGADGGLGGAAARAGDAGGGYGDVAV